ncbi:MAG: MCE family protein [Rhodocyclaceae bacterium]|nr:MCE family protein [Rhodocyclaceae bacterium]
MTEPLPADLPQAQAAPRSPWRPSLVWLIPIVTALIGGWLAVQTILQRGTEITISFSNAEGLEAGKTRIKYKNVDIGEVSAITLAPDHRSVIVTARIRRSVENLLVQGTRFWVVRPRVAASGVSGLSTLLSGTYIGADLGKSSESEHEFVGLESPPAITADRPGRSFLLHGADMGSLDIGSPLFYRRVQVGQVSAYKLDEDGSGVALQVFVEQPYDRFVTQDTRFWQASGLNLTLDAAGLRFDSESLVSLVVGGIAFINPPGKTATEAAPENASFTLYDNPKAALRRPDRVAEDYVLLFDESVRGLNIGAPVDFRGLEVGEVISVDVDYDSRNGGFNMAVGIRVYPERLRGQPNPKSVRARMDSLVARGLRAQLRSGNLLTGQLYVAMDVFPKDAPAKINWDASPPRLPTTPGSLNALQDSVGQIAKKLVKLPLEEIAADLRRTLAEVDGASRKAGKLMDGLDRDLAPAAQAALVEARGALAEARRNLSADAPLQNDLRDAAREIARAAQALRLLAETLEAQPESLLRGKRKDASAP